jgi:uncharacterized caspase-like protein
MFLIGTGFGSISADASSRIGLVVGIAGYDSLQRLNNTRRDAELVGSSLEKVGFSVTRLLDADLVTIRSAIKQFSFEAEVADIAVIYFAGHGVEFNGVNYLLPKDVSLTDGRFVSEKAVPLAELLDAVQSARQLRIIVLDSCRNSPFPLAQAAPVQQKPPAPDSALTGQPVEKAVQQAGGQQERGLAPVSSGLAKPAPTQGTLVFYAAEAGAVASDGDGQNSPFAQALANEFVQPDVEIGLMLRAVRDDVIGKTNGIQVPHTYGTLSSKPFFLAGERQSKNKLSEDERKRAWSELGYDQNKLLESLAAEGDLRAITALAYHKLNPASADYDPQKAIGLLEQASDGGALEATFELAEILEQGIGINPDVRRALQLYEKAAAGNYAKAITNLGFIYFLGGDGIRKDTEKAIGYFARAAELAEPAGLFNYATMIDAGLVKGKTSDQTGNYLYRSLRGGNETVLEKLIAEPNMFDKRVRVALQGAMKKAGFYQGTLDGDFGPATLQALALTYGQKSN